ncbi:hypothetical protein Tco_0938816 [Tanacetum coccineum]|uniref:Uncharacterized protein n=1 Tax=Tanacetum coccineum TaxID=301880 RepID=A0ABQ5DIA6_9ASTR
MTPPVITTSVQSSNRFLKSKITKTNCGSTIIRDSQQPYQQLIPKGVGLVQYVPPSATYVSTRRNHLLRFPILYGISKIPSDVLLLCYLYLENLTKARSLWGSASREFLEKPEHFSHPTIDLLALLENGVLKSFHPFGVRCHVIPYSSFKSEILYDVVGTSGYHCGVLRSFPAERIEQGNGSKILPCGDGSCWKAFKPIASLIA